MHESELQYCDQSIQSQTPLSCSCAKYNQVKITDLHHKVLSLIYKFPIRNALSHLKRFNFGKENVHEQDDILYQQSKHQFATTICHPTRDYPPKPVV